MDLIFTAIFKPFFFLPFFIYKDVNFWILEVNFNDLLNFAIENSLKEEKYKKYS